MRKTFILAAACAAAIGSPARAAFTVDLLESGADVVATGGGSLDLTDLSLVASGVAPSDLLFPAGGAIAYGGTAAAALYEGLGGPAGFGPGLAAIPTSQTGDFVGEAFDGVRLLEVPLGYLSGTALANSATFANQSFASLGATPGVYVWTWGQGDHADSFTLNVGPIGGGVPEPAAWALLVAGFAAAGAALRRRRASVMTC